MQVYLKTLANAMLSSTSDVYGDYLLNYPEIMSGRRVRIEVAQGRRVHFEFYSSAGGEAEGEPGTSVPIPLLGGVLGLRKAIVHRDNVEAFARLNSAKSLQSLVVGQGAQWPDNTIYKNAGIALVGAKEYDNLLPMLMRKRFDFLPLSIIEIDGVLEKQTTVFDALVVEDNTFIYYPIPTYIRVSDTQPELLGRLNLGLKRIQASGEFRAIMQKYIEPYVKGISAQQAKLFVLENPMLTEQENRSRSRRITETYFADTQKIFWLY
ncbi:MAG: hypothetical protein COA42_15835 [Alteromonadaceae bacterium]|nr:MAG: hypothetical protein COA42_15835 [Alteromonadaceae bacterium]